MKIEGTSGNDVLAGTSDSDQIYGKGGDDVIFSGGGAEDDVFGDSGNDTVHYNGSGFLSFDGGGGNDTIVVDVTFDTTWFLQDSDEAFIGNVGADSVTVINPSATTKRNFNGGDGNDTLTGGAGDDRLTGGKGTDMLTGGLGNDILIGDRDDTAIFAGKVGSTSGGVASQYTITNLGDGDFSIVGPDGHDTTHNILYAQFDNNTVPLVTWHFEVDRNQDGTARISLTENGRQIASDVAAYDDTTPITSGRFDLVYRTNSSIAPGRNWEFMDYTGKSDFADRNDIEIHVGNSTHDSEGCIVASNATFLTAVRKEMDKLLANTTVDQTAGIQFYNLPIPIDVTVKDVNGAVLQPTAGFKAVGDADHGGVATTKLVLAHDGRVAGLTKDLIVDFSLKGNTADVSIPGATADGRWEYTITAGQTSSANIPITILTSKSETLDFHIIKVTIQDSKHTYVDKHHLLFGSDLLLQVNGGPAAIATSQIGAEHLRAGAGANQFTFDAVADSTSRGYDKISGFDALQDKIDVWFKVHGVDAGPADTLLRLSHFDSDLSAALDASVLKSHHAVVFTPDQGGAAGHSYLVVDANGVAGYQAGEDLVIELVRGTHLNDLGAASFT